MTNMTDTNDTTKPADANPLAAPSLPVSVHAQYVKDISFENPAAPQSLRGGLEQPKMDVSINLDVKSLDDPSIKSLYEVALRISVRANRKDQVLYIAEVLYGAAVSMPQVAPEHHHPLLLIEIPKMLFPFARKVIADLVQDGGYPPLLLGPVDFAAMYLARFGQENADTAKSSDAAA